jgi:glycerophosphoryl diester phosphodiesterase
MGHRGAAESAPENTLAAFKRAKALGAPWIELDIQLTIDGQCAVFHDETLERITGRTERVDQVPLALVTGLDAGAWFDPAFSGERIPTLDQALAAIAGLGLGVNIELKRHPGWETETARSLAEAVERSWPAGLAPPMVSSFADTMLAETRRFAPHLPRAYLVRPLRSGYLEEAAELGCVSVNLYQGELTPEEVEAVKSAGLQLAAWVVDDAAQARTLWEWGVDSIITGAPDRIVSALHARGEVA